jgi:hypothetical protein
MDLGDWPGALADAALVPTDFEFVLPYHASGAWRYFNAYSVHYCCFTLWNTFSVDYFLTTGDPRMPWEDMGTVALNRFDEIDVVDIPDYRQRKYPDDGSDMNLATGDEMRLLEAEALLRGGAGGITEAMVLINALRGRAGMADYPVPADLTEAWAFYKQERGIELWLEGRRLWDFRRWDADNTPGALHPLDDGITPFGGPDLSNRALCLPIPLDETEINENFQ